MATVNPAVVDVPTTANHYQWWSLVREDWDVRYEGLLVARELAKLAEEFTGEVRISQRSLADAVSVADGEGRTRATVERGLENLRRRGWVVRLNPGAPRTEKTHLMLIIPARVLVQPIPYTPGGYISLGEAENAA